MTNRKNMSIMELADQILSEHERAMTFIELFDLICAEKSISDEDKAGMISQVYADFISSAKFIYVGDDEWDKKGRRTIDLWDKDGAYYDEYPDYEEELSLFEGGKTDGDYSVEVPAPEEEEEESIYEADVTEDDIKDEDDISYDDFEEDKEDYIEDEKDLVVKEDILFEEEDEETEEFDDEEYNEYMDDYEEMYED